MVHLGYALEGTCMIISFLHALCHVAPCCLHCVLCGRCGDGQLFLDLSPHTAAVVVPEGAGPGVPTL